MVAVTVERWLPTVILKSRLGLVLTTHLAHQAHRPRVLFSSPDPAITDIYIKAQLDVYPSET